MTCKEFLKSIEFDPIDPQSVLNAIKSATDVEFDDFAQNLYCIGYIIDKNKEAFIRKLKKETGEAKQKVSESEDKIKSLEVKLEKLRNQSKPVSKKIEQPKKVEPFKKKVIVVKKKV